MSVVGYSVGGVARFRNFARREWWGYGVWGLVGIVIGVGEVWAAIGNPWWPTISATTGHLEQLWSPVKIIVVALIAAGVVGALRYPPSRNAFPASAGRAARWRTDSGRLTRSQGGEVAQLSGYYFALAVIVVGGAAAVTVALGASKFTVGYVLYGLMAVVLLIVPNALAFWLAKEVPFPTLFWTLRELDKRWHSAVMVVVAGLAVLVVHLVAYPWP